jgi:hypothetical protein
MKPTISKSSQVYCKFSADQLDVTDVHTAFRRDHAKRLDKISLSTTLRNFCTIKNYAQNTIEYHCNINVFGRWLANSVVRADVNACPCKQTCIIFHPSPFLFFIAQ